MLHIIGLPKKGHEDRCDTLWFIRTFKPSEIEGFALKAIVYTCDILSVYEPLAGYDYNDLPQGIRRSTMYEFFTAVWRSK